MFKMIKTDTRAKSRSSALIVYFEHTLLFFFLMCQLLILNIFLLTETEREIW